MESIIVACITGVVTKRGVDFLVWLPNARESRGAAPRVSSSG